MNRRIEALMDPDRPVFLTDGGLETTLLFHEGWDLPAFAAFPLLDSTSGRYALRAYYERYIRLARSYQTGFVLESPTWRASAGWMSEVGYRPDDVVTVNRSAIELMQTLRDDAENWHSPMLISGCVGPEGDAYAPADRLTVGEANQYHLIQVAALEAAGADLVTGVTLAYVEEAVGLTLAAAAASIPVVISFTVETDGRLPSGTTLADAIRLVDAATPAPPLYYMVNCAHPDHFLAMLNPAQRWCQRIAGVRANASRCSHAELDEAEVLDAGDPLEFGSLYGELIARLPGLRVIGGCCGTDHRHVAAAAGHCVGSAIATACSS